MSHPQPKKSWQLMDDGDGTVSVFFRDTGLKEVQRASFRVTPWEKVEWQKRDSRLESREVQEREVCLLSWQWHLIHEGLP